MKKSFELILPLMEKHGISKAALAKIASVRPSAVTKWANGGSIRIAQLSKIAEYFGVDMRELMPHDDSPEVKKSESVSDVEFWKQRALDAEEKLRNVKEALPFAIKWFEKLQEAVK